MTEYVFDIHGPGDDTARYAARLTALTAEVNEGVRLNIITGELLISTDGGAARAQGQADDVMRSATRHARARNF